MTDKKTKKTKSKKTKSKKSTKSSKKNEKIFIIDYINESKYSSADVVGAITSEGLFSTLEMEKLKLNPPSFTKEELDKICKKYLGDK